MTTHKVIVCITNKMPRKGADGHRRMTLDWVMLISTWTIQMDYQHTQPCDSSLKQYGNMAFWNSCNIDILQSLKSRDSLLRRKFRNRTPTSCRPGSILS